jgi:hypothetical protein
MQTHPLAVPIEPSGADAGEDLLADAPCGRRPSALGSNRQTGGSMGKVAGRHALVTLNGRRCPAAQQRHAHRTGPMVLLEKAARARSELSCRQVELVVTTGRGGRLHPQSGTSEILVSCAQSIQRSIATPMKKRERALWQEGTISSIRMPGMASFFAILPDTCPIVHPRSPLTAVCRMTSPAPLFGLSCSGLHDLSS